MIDIRCACGQGYHAEESHIGRSLRCWKCGAILSVERGAPLSPSHPSGGEHVTSPATAAQSAELHKPEHMTPGLAVVVEGAEGKSLGNARELEGAGNPLGNDFEPISNRRD